MNQQLDELDEPTEYEFNRDLEMQNDPAYLDALTKSFWHRLKRGRVIIAAKRRDVNALDRLTAHDPALKDLAIRQLARVRRRGRRKGEARPRDLTQVERIVLEDAISDVDSIRRICKAYFDRWKGSDSIAIEIAAKRSHLNPEKLRNFRKNRARDGRRK